MLQWRIVGWPGLAAHVLALCLLRLAADVHPRLTSPCLGLGKVQVYKSHLGTGKPT